MVQIDMPVVVKLDNEIIRHATRLVENRIDEHRSELAEIVQQIEACGYTREAGPLENNAAWRRLRELAGVQG